MSSFWRNFNHWLHWKLSFWQLPVQPVMKISSKWRHFRFSGDVNPGTGDGRVVGLRRIGLPCGKRVNVMTSSSNGQTLVSDGQIAITHDKTTMTSVILVLCWCLFPSLLRNSGNKHKNNPLLSTGTIRHSSTHIILYIFDGVFLSVSYR